MDNTSEEFYRRQRGTYSGGYLEHKDVLRDRIVADPLGALAEETAEAILDYRIEKHRRNGEVSKESLVLKKIVLDNLVRLAELGKNREAKKFNILWAPEERKDDDGKEDSGSSE